MDALFIVGSACFALGSVPGYSSAVPAEVVVVTFFVGSLFFTTAATLQYLGTTDGRMLAWRPWDIAWAAAIIQLVGTLWFNIDTFAARDPGLDAEASDLRIWTPDYLGSVCFLVASALAVIALGRRPWHTGRDWRIAALNLLGSVFFMAAAIAAFVLPDADDLVDATLANSGTFLGAVCFLVAAWMDITPPE
jgi:YrhK-like protein